MCLIWRASVAAPNPCLHWESSPEKSFQLYFLCKCISFTKEMNKKKFFIACASPILYIFMKPYYTKCSGKDWTCADAALLLCGSYMGNKKTFFSQTEALG